MIRLPSVLQNLKRSFSSPRKIIPYQYLKRSFTNSRRLSSQEDIRLLPWQFLRATDSSNYDLTTWQRTDVPYDSATGKPGKRKNSNIFSIQQVFVDGEDYKVLWSDGLSSRYSMVWVQQQLNLWKDKLPQDRILWKNLSEANVRDSSDLSIEFTDLITDNGMNRALKALYQYGILLVTETPIDDNGAGVAALGAAVGGGSVKESRFASLLANYRAGGQDIILPQGTDGPLRTLYGTVWSTSSEAQTDGSSVADSAYGSDALPLHTDMTYLRDPPGLQIFTMVQPAIEGGESVFADGFAVADELKRTDPASSDVLSKTIRWYCSIDPVTGWQLEASGSVIQVCNGQVTSIRHNDLDRLADLPPANISQADEIDAFYESLECAHTSWDSLLSQDKFRLVMKLRPGDTMVVANQRCFHGRCSFESTKFAPRAVMGCYISQDELYSRFRMEGFLV